MESLPGKKGKVDYKLTSTVMLSAVKKDMFKLEGNLTRQDNKVSYRPHLLQTCLIRKSKAFGTDLAICFYCFLCLRSIDRPTDRIDATTAVATDRLTDRPTDRPIPRDDSDRHD